MTTLLSWSIVVVRYMGWNDLQIMMTTMTMMMMCLSAVVWQRHVSWIYHQSCGKSQHRFSLSLAPNYFCGNLWEQRLCEWKIQRIQRTAVAQLQWCDSCQRSPWAVAAWTTMMTSSKWFQNLPYSVNETVIHDVLYHPLFHRQATDSTRITWRLL